MNWSEFVETAHPAHKHALLAKIAEGRAGQLTDMLDAGIDPTVVVLDKRMHRVKDLAREHLNGRQVNLSDIGYRLMTEWLKTNCHGRWAPISRREWAFEKVTDAVHFKLYWYG